MIVSYFNRNSSDFGYYTDWQSLEKSILQFNPDALIIILNSELAHELKGRALLNNYECTIHIIEPGELIPVPLGTYAFLIHEHNKQTAYQGRNATLLPSYLAAYK